MQKLVDLDYEQNMGLLVTLTGGEAEEILGMARYDVDPATRLADIAFVVRDDWQGRGLGTLLMRRMAGVARARGLAGFTADVLSSNKPMMQVFHHSGLRVDVEFEDGCYHLTMHLQDPAAVEPTAT
jgi:GNAT superfamily N-acetyltransferase